MSPPATPFAAVFAAIPTFYKEDGQIDVTAVRHIVEYVVAREAHGVGVLFEASEDPLLSEDERRILVDTVADVCADRAPFIVNVSAPATRPAVDLVRHAASKGAMGVVISPFRLPGLGYRALYRHFDRLTKASEGPTYLGVRPEGAADMLTPEELATLGGHEGLAGAYAPGASAAVLKHWAKRLKSRTGALFTACSFDFSDRARAGATASICGLAVLGIEKSVALAQAFTQGDVQTIRRIERQVAPAVEVLGPPKTPDELSGVKRLAARIAQRPLEGGLLMPVTPFAMVKEGLRLQGHPVRSLVRPPYERVGPSQSERLRSVMKSAGLLS